MDRKQHRRLQSLLAELDTGERNKLMRRATRMRRAAMRSGRRDPKRLGLDDFLLELLEPGPMEGVPLTTPTDAADTTAPFSRGVVVNVTGGACRVQVDSNTQTASANSLPPGALVAATLSDDLARRQKSDLTVGDEVLIEPAGEGHRVSTVLPRRSLLSRADPHVPQRRRAIAANVDLVVVVVAAEAPPLHPRLIDRYLIAVEHSGAAPVLIVNKIDLLDVSRRDVLQTQLRPYEMLGVPVIPCSVTSGDGIDAVRAALAGHVCVFVGQSGTGKSSLLNALCGETAAQTGAVRSGDGRGRHTTTATELYELADGIRVIDTPGIRRFSVHEADPERIAAGFAEFAPYADACRFRDCIHKHEPGCAVRRAVTDGAISRTRYASYLKLLDGDDAEEPFLHA